MSGPHGNGPSIEQDPLKGYGDPAIVVGMDGGAAMPTGPVGSDEDKAQAGADAASMDMIAGELTMIAGALVFIDPPLSGAVAVAAGVAAFASGVFSAIAADPPQASYKALPVLQGRQPRRAPPTAEPARSVDDTIRAGLRLMDAAEAQLDALERWQGAYRAGDAIWVELQGAAYATHANQTRMMREDYAASLSRLGGRLRAAGHAGSAASLSAYREMVRENGLPPDLPASFADAGLSRFGDSARLVEWLEGVEPRQPRGLDALAARLRPAENSLN